jgi:adenylate cyclase
MTSPAQRPAPPAWAVVTEDTDRHAARLLRAYAEGLVAEGVPLWRCSTFLLSRHPDVVVRQLIWRLGEKFSAENHRYQGIQDEAYLRSPVKVVQDTRAPVRRRLTDPGTAQEFPGLGPIFREGGTDYFALPLVFADGRCSFLSFVTDLPTGFSDAHLARLTASVSEIAPKLELASAQYALESLLSVYLGPSAANRILRGDARHGVGGVIHGALWRCELGGSRRVADTLPAAEVLSLLDQYVEVATGAVIASEGEVLELGEGAILGVFPVQNAGPVDACRRALAAGERAIRELEALARERGFSTPPRIAMHLGEVTYGNVGSSDRLHFAALGEPVNEVARLGHLCRVLKVPLLVSRRFADHLPKEFVSLGEHTPREADLAHEVLTLERFRP